MDTKQRCNELTLNMILEPLDEIEQDARRRGMPVFREPMDEVEWMESHPNYVPMRSNDKWDWKCSVIAIVGVLTIAGVIYLASIVS